MKVTGLGIGSFAALALANPSDEIYEETVTKHVDGYKAHHHSDNSISSTASTVTITTTTISKAEVYKHNFHATGSSGFLAHSVNYTYPVGTAPPRTTLSTTTRSAMYNKHRKTTSSASSSTATWSAAEAYKVGYEA
ncbi:uncharacterized protein CLAFUR5_20185 [Fulvia fulva]|uniref:uncharacterized protein n=1 Tax=Passalora fulva TaxID=5499 RepID=UPI0004E9C2A2|nr:uncharacterized protein CLAFUR5_20185 [Fulvia fulva]KAK4627917.1 hypothetical protein CLAFUR0_04633 [Fulvia fulva]WMI38869.1 hypothetical protein CLAFUR5_20185 [Fulvia fulva]WPV29228.1 hypothetical protein CLAFUW7_04637 [Fulvia fulva]